ALNDSPACVSRKLAPVQERLRSIVNVSAILAHPRLDPFFFSVLATAEIYTLSLHDALPISPKVVSLLMVIVPWLSIEPLMVRVQMARAQVWTPVALVRGTESRVSVALSPPQLPSLESRMSAPAFVKELAAVSVATALQSVP